MNENLLGIFLFSFLLFSLFLFFFVNANLYPEEHRRDQDKRENPFALPLLKMELKYRLVVSKRINLVKISLKFNKWNNVARY